MNSKKELVRFVGYDILTFTNEDGHFVAVKPLSDLFQLEWSSQVKRLKRDQILSSVMVIMTTTGADGKQYEMVCLPLKYFPGWLFKIDIGRIKNEFVKPLILEFQKSAYVALYDHFMGDAEKHKGEVQKYKKKLNGERRDYSQQILNLYMNEILKGHDNYILGKWIFRMKQFFCFKDIAVYGNIPVARIRSLYKRYVHFIDATRYERYYNCYHSMDAADYYDIRREMEKFGHEYDLVKYRDELKDRRGTIDAIMKFRESSDKITEVM